MKTLSLLIILTLFISNTALAKKPEWAGKGKPTKEQVKAHKESMKAKKGVESEYEKMEGKPEKTKDKKKNKIKGDKQKLRAISDKEKNKKVDKSTSEVRKQKADKDKTTAMEAKKAKSEVKEKTDKDKSAEKAKEVRKKWWQLF